jgi:hypothetical protein
VSLGGRGLGALEMGALEEHVLPCFLWSATTAAVRAPTSWNHAEAKPPPRPLSRSMTSVSSSHRLSAIGWLC